MTIILLVFSSITTDNLSLNQEARVIIEALEKSKEKDKFTLELRSVNRPSDLQRVFLEVNPNIVHFLGNETSSYEGLVFQDQSGQRIPLSSEALASLFKLFEDRVECVVLRDIYSETQVKAIAQHINYVIGIQHAIISKNSLVFIAGFYEALFSGSSIENAYLFGRNAIELEGFPESNYPILNQKVEKSSISINLRQRLEDEIRKDFEILKVLEDELRFEIDNSHFET